MIQLGIVVLGNDRDVKEGDVVKCSGDVVQVPVGHELLGRVVNALGDPIDDGGEIRAKNKMYIESKAPEVIEVKNLSGDTVMFGATVTVSMLGDDNSEIEYVYKIVGGYEADASKQLISTDSPLGSALIGKKVGEYVEVIVPNGEKLYKIVKIEFK
nr:unnamed protein product [Callosobruchus chinensis]